MPAELLVYWSLAKAGFRKQSHYLSAMFAGLFTNIVFGFVRASILLTAVRSGADVGGYDEGSVGAYVWISQGLLGAIQMMGPAPEVADRIKNGDVAIDLVRPVDIQIGYLAADLGRAAFTFLPRGLPSVLVGWLTFDLTMPGGSAPYLLGLFSIVLGVTLSFLSQFAIAVLGFWVVETRGLRSLYTVAGTFLAGLFVPVHLFPSWLKWIADGTPFPSVLQTPIDVLSGRVMGVEAVEAVLGQVVWVALVMIAGRLLLRAGARKLEVQGG